MNNWRQSIEKSAHRNVKWEFNWIIKSVRNTSQNLSLSGHPVAQIFNNTSVARQRKNTVDSFLLNEKLVTLTHNMLCRILLSKATVVNLKIIF